MTRFGIFVSYDDYFAPVAALTIPVLADYARRHGYFLDVLPNPPITRTLVWDRARTIIDNLERYDWTIHMDADILITNHRITLEEIVAQFPPERDMILARDHTGLNDGMIFNRNGPRMNWLLEHLWSMEGEVSSLAATWRFIRETPHQTIIGEVPQKLLHCYPYREYGIDYPEGTWELGDFAYHLPAMTTARRVELFTPMLERIVW